MTETLQAIGEVSIEAMHWSSSVDVKAAASPGKRPTFRIVANTGEKMNVGFGYPVVVDLTGLTANSSIPVLLDHDATRIVGQSTEIKITPTEVVVSGLVTGDDDDAKKVVSHSKNGFRWQASIGAEVILREFVEAGKNVTVNGRSVSGPVIIAREANLYETSFVSIGADKNTHATIAAKKGSSILDFEQFASAKGFDPTSLSVEQRHFLQASFEAERSGGVATDIAQERDRVSQIHAAVAASGVTFGLNDHGDRIENLAARATKEGWSASKVELMIARAERDSSPLSRPFQNGVDPYASEREVIVAKLLCQSGFRDYVEATYKPQIIEAADRRKGEIGFKDIERIQATGFSTISVPTIVSDLANKVAHAATKEAASSWREFAAIKSSPDFKTSTSVGMDIVGELEEIGPTGQITHGGAVEGSYEWKIGTYAKMISLTRQMIINDDLSLFSDTLPQLARAGRRSLDDKVASTIIDSTGHFVAGNANLLEAGSALSITSLSLALTKMRTQRRNGWDLDIVPKVLWVAPELETTARAILNSMEIAAAAGNPTGNALKGVLSLAVDPRLSNPRFGGDAANWYVFAGPEYRPLIVAFLDGKQTPTVESENADFNQLGTQFRVVYDYAVTLADPQAGVKATGAA